MKLSAAEFKIKTALLLCKFAEKAYEAEAEFDMTGEGFEPSVFVEDKKTDTQGFIAIHDSRNEIVVVFRGTEIKWRDLLTDAKFLASGYTYSSGIKGFFGRIFLRKRVHSGFLKAYRSVRSTMHEKVLEYVSGRPNDAKVFVTGHSLGGALATLCALDLQEMFIKKNLDEIPITIYTFGSPRVGTKRFANYFNTKIPDSWRITNNEDIIPTVPPRLGFLRQWLSYCHVSHFKFIDENGKFDDTRTDKEEQKPVKWSALLKLLGEVFDPDSLGDHEIQKYYERLQALLGA
ncbi:MAG: lipase family protein [Candidatus Hodarchaeota archaeon]